MDLGLQNRVALVTGGTSGIGFAIAKCLFQEGAHVVIASRNETHVNAAVDSLAAIGPKERVEGVVLDLTNETQIRRVVGDINRKNGIDILVNNVGGPAAGNPLQITLEDWDRGYQSLLRSVILLSLLTVPTMREKKWGRILTVTSTSAKEIIPKLPVSSTFRAGLTAWTKELSQEVGPYQVLVNNLLPGPTNTSRLKELAVKSPDFYKSMASESALKRIAEPEEIGRVATFLCSGANTYVTGTDVLVDGGYTKAL